jgi:hypothetical protein
MRRLRARLELAPAMGTPLTFLAIEVVAIEIVAIEILECDP